MSRLLRTIALVAVVGGGALLASPESADARPRDRYWNNYWRWYDNDYRPYHYRYNYRRTPYGGYQYNYRYYRPYNYNDRYYRPYNRYYRGFYPNSVQVGPLRFGWR